MELTEYESKVVNRIGQLCHDGVLSNCAMVQIIELMGNDFLQLKTIQQYADDLNISYQAARKHKIQHATLFGKKLIIDNQ